MKTKIVYCIVSTEKDVYLEQAWVSIYTLRRYNADAHVTLLVDRATEATLTGKRSGIRDLVDEVVAVDAPEGYDAMQRSRFLKTNFRQFLSGDLLFIDSDTAIGGSLADIDNTDADIACVPDGHQPIKDYDTDYSLANKLRGLFGIEVEVNRFYFNSGVIYVKDVPRAHSFFKDWYECWCYSVSEHGCNFDQPALYAADKRNGFIIKELPGEYNCQVFISLQYLHRGLVLHFFDERSSIRTKGVSPFYDVKTFLSVKEAGDINGDVKSILDDSTKWFVSPSYFISNELFYFLCSPIGVLLYNAYVCKSHLYKAVVAYHSLRKLFHPIKEMLKGVFY